MESHENKENSVCLLLYCLLDVHSRILLEGCACDACVCKCAHLCMSMRRPKVNIKYLPLLFPSLCFESGVLTEPGAR